MIILAILHIVGLAHSDIVFGTLTYHHINIFGATI